MSTHLRESWGQTSGVRTASIRSHLQQLADFQRQHFHKGREGWKYHSVEELVLAYGRSYQPGLRPDDVCQGEMKMCYSNAFQLVIDRHDLTYVEGYGYTRFFPMGHAWATADGRTAIDPTWEDGTDYFGIPFRTSWVSSFISRSGYYGVLFPEIPNEPFLDLLRNGIPSGAIA